MRVSVKSPVASKAGEAAHKMKAVVDAVAGAKYTQTFHQDSSWDSHLRKTVKGDWAATGTVTLPIEAGKWGAADGGGSAAVSALINKLLALTSASSAPTPAQQQLSQYGGDVGYRRRRLQAYGEGEEEGKGDDNDNKSYSSDEQDGYGYGGGGQQSDGSDYSEPNPTYAAPVQQQQFRAAPGYAAASSGERVLGSRLGCSSGRCCSSTNATTGAPDSLPASMQGLRWPLDRSRTR